MLYYTVEGIVFNAWCEQRLPYPRGSQISRKAQTQGMVVAIEELHKNELIAWINRRNDLAAKLGTAFLPDPTLKRIHFYEQARERLATVRRPSLP
jgi:hypothetical protein